MAKDRILIIEDNESLNLFYKGVLASLNIKIDTATTFEDAILKLKEFDYCFHIIDITLHGSEPGTQVIGKCGADPRSCLVLSASMTEELVTELKEVYGVPRDLIMTKPVDADALFNLVKSRLTTDDLIENEENSLNLNESENGRLQSELFIFKHLFHYIIQHKFRSIIFVIFSVAFMNFFISYMKIDAYNEIYHTIEQNQEYRFRHYNKGNNVGSTSFVEISGYQLIRSFNEIVSKDPSIVDNDPVYNYINRKKQLFANVKIKFYPKDNYLIVIVTSDNTIRHVWIPDKQYLDKFGLGEDLTFLDIIIKAWTASFTNL